MQASTNSYYLPKIKFQIITYYFIFFSISFINTLLISTIGINRSSDIIQFVCSELTRVGRFLEALCCYLIAGHTKFDPDRVFGWLAICLAKVDMSNILYVYRYHSVVYNLTWLEINLLINSNFAQAMRAITSVVILWAKDIRNLLDIIHQHFQEISPIKLYQGFKVRVKKDFRTGGIQESKNIGLWR